MKPSSQKNTPPPSTLSSVIRLTGVRLAGDRCPKDPQLITKISRIIGVPTRAISDLKILRRSLDRRQRPIMTEFQVAFRLSYKSQKIDKLLKKNPKNHQISRWNSSEEEICSPSVPPGHTLIVGAGPAGLMAAWALVCQGMPVTVLDRGDDVDHRLPIVGHLWARGQLDSESNACFGEGGAGAFSDGKLITRNRSVWKKFVLKTLVDFGANSQILIDSQAHIGSDRLRRVVKAWREEMKRRGAHFRFRSRVDDLIVHQEQAIGVRLASGEEIFADRILWAVGGHARDSQEILLRYGVRIKPRSLAVGVRIEHPQALVNLAMGGYEEGSACEYKLKTRVGSRGVYSFCMCPGGVVIAAASNFQQQVVNGMSCHGKKSRYANSALVVEMGTGYFPSGSLGGFDFQQILEKKAFDPCHPYHAPAQRLVDFLKNTSSSTLPKTSYRPGVMAWNLRELLPPEVSQSLVRALPDFSQKLKGYISQEALLLGVETRTSCPVTVVRGANKEATLSGLYCVGEGAGYAGGILSAAYDALNVLSFLSQQPIK